MGSKRTATLFLAYASTLDELREAVLEPGGERVVNAIFDQARSLPGDERLAALLAVAHFARRQPKRSRAHFERELSRSARRAR